MTIGLPCFLHTCSCFLVVSCGANEPISKNVLMPILPHRLSLVL